MRISINARRWLTVPLAAATLLSVAAFGGDGQDGGKLVFSDDFVDDSNGWGSDSTPEYDVGINAENETLDMVVSADPGQLLEWYPDEYVSRAEKLRDVRIDADVSFTSPGAAVLECRAADPTGEAGDLSSYLFVAYPDGHVAIHEQLPNGAVEKLAATSESDPVFDGEAVTETFVTLGAQCEGGKDGKPVRLTMFVDGDKVLSAKDTEDPYTKGAFLVTAGKSASAIDESGFEPFAVVWDNVELTQL